MLRMVPSLAQGFGDCRGSTSCRFWPAVMSYRAGWLWPPTGPQVGRIRDLGGRVAQGCVCVIDAVGDDDGLRANAQVTFRCRRQASAVCGRVRAPNCRKMRTGSLTRPATWPVRALPCCLPTP